MSTGKPFLRACPFFQWVLTIESRCAKIVLHRQNANLSKRREKSQANSKEWLFSFLELTLSPAEHAGAHSAGAAAYLSALTSKFVVCPVRGLASLSDYVISTYPAKRRTGVAGGVCGSSPPAPTSPTRRGLFILI